MTAFSIPRGEDERNEPSVGPRPLQVLPSPAADAVAAGVAAVGAVAVESAAVVMPAYAEHPRLIGTLWDRLGWTDQIASLPGPTWGGSRLTDPCSPLQALRIAVRKTLAQVAARVGVTPEHVSHWEHGDYPVAFRHVPALARALGLTEADLVRKLQPGEVCAGRD